MSRLKTKLGYEDYAAIDDGQRYELIDGELCMVPAPSEYHQSISGNLYLALRGHVDRHRLGIVLYAPQDVRIADHDVLQPDLLFISHERRSIRAGKFIRGAPDLVVEILSQGTAGRDRGAKSAIYHRADVREMWIVDPDAERIEVFLPGAEGFKLNALYHGDERVRSTVLPDLELRADEAFAD